MPFFHQLNHLCLRQNGESSKISIKRKILRQAGSCKNQFVDDFLLDEKYSKGSCDPRHHRLPTLNETDFLKRCHFSEKTRYIFVILAHKSLAMLSRLLNKLSSKETLLLVLIDRFEDPDFISSCTKLTAFYSNRCLVQHGGIVYLTASEMQSIMAAMNWAAKENSQWTHLITLTEQDYPLLKIASLLKRIETVGNKTWVQPAVCFDDVNVYNSSAGYFGRMKTFMYPCIDFLQNNRKIVLQISRRDPWIFRYINMSFCWASSITTVWSRETIEYLLSDPAAISSYAFFTRRGPATVEHFWPSLLSKARHLIHLQTPCFMDWKHGLGEDGTNKSIDGVHNTFLTISEKNLIEKAYLDGIIFARKFFYNHFDVLDYIDNLEQLAKNAKANQHFVDVA